MRVISGKNAGRLVAVVVLALTLGTGGRADTLADALVGAYNQSGLLDQNRALLRAADEDVALAASALKPIINWSGDIQRRFGDSRSALGFPANLERSTAEIALTADLLLYDFGATAAGVAAAKETVLATRQTLISIEQQVLLRAVSAYMGVIEASEQVELRQNNLRLLTQELRAAENRFEVGEVTRTDVALAEAQLAQARSGLATAQGNSLIAIEEYRNVVGRQPGRLAAPPKLPTPAAGVDAAKAMAVRSHPSMLAAQYQVAAADLNIQGTKADMKPTINLQGRLAVQEEYNSPSYLRSGSVGVRVTGPIYQGGRLSAAVRRAQAQRDAARGNLHVVRNDVQQRVGDAYARLASARASIEASQRRIVAARIAFEGVREEATLGARTTLDVLDAEQALLDAEASLITAQAQLYVTAYSVLEATGRLTARDLRLPVQVYDPNEYYNLVKDSPTAISKQGKQLDRVLKRLQKD